METKIILAGSGGQGIMFMGKLLAEAAVREGKNVTYFPAYGAEVRGGTANCTIVISDEEIGSPYAETTDILVAMNAPSLQRFNSQVKKGGQVIVNSSLVKDIGTCRCVGFPFTQMAVDLGSAQAANMVAIGCLAHTTGIVSLDGILAALEHLSLKAGIIALNKKAVQAGARG
jgi:2-oxoglutarate ferredoxin oxidoreductase subunit gamma